MGLGAIATKNQWFEEKRDLFIRNLVHEFFKTSVSFAGLYEKFLRTGEASFEELDRLVGTDMNKGILWRLKDRCHQVWGGASPHRELHGCLLDWMIGSIFHESMKLKENVYMCQYYKPLAEKVDVCGLPELGTMFGMERKRFIEKIHDEIMRQIDALGIMFGQASFLMRMAITTQSGNPLLIRLFLEKPELVKAVWHESVEGVFDDMYGGSPETGYLAAVRSYIEGHWYEKALHTCRRCLEIAPGSEEAKKQIAQLSMICRSLEG